MRYHINRSCMMRGVPGPGTRAELALPGEPLHRARRAGATPRPKEGPKGKCARAGGRPPTRNSLRAMLQRLLLLWLVLLSGLALLWPQILVGLGVPPQDAAGWDPFAASRPLLPWLFAGVMFCLGCLLPRNELAQVLRRWPRVLGGTVTQYSVMPLGAWLLARAMQLPEELQIGVVLVGCVPGAMASNVLTLTARGNVSYSVSLTTSATLLSPLVVPLCLYLIFRQGHEAAGLLARQAFWVLVSQVVGPVLGGHLLARAWTGLGRWTRRWGSTVANLGILWIIAYVVATNRQRLLLWDVRLWSTLLLLNSIGYAGGYFGARLLRLPEGMKRALVLEVGMQNAGLGTVLAAQLFPHQAAIPLPAALYTFGCMFTGTVLAAWWSRRPVAPGPVASTPAEAPAQPQLAAGKGTGEVPDA